MAQSFKKHVRMRQQVKWVDCWSSRNKLDMSIKDSLLNLLILMLGALKQGTSSNRWKGVVWSLVANVIPRLQKEILYFVLTHIYGTAPVSIFFKLKFNIQNKRADEIWFINNVGLLQQQTV